MIADLGDASKVQTFLSVSNVQTFINYQDTDGHTPLFKAAKKGHAAVVDQLIAARCNLNLVSTVKHLLSPSLSLSLTHTHTHTRLCIPRRVSRE